MEGSTSSPVFATLAEDLATRLHAHASEQARGMEREARELARVFRDWQNVRPDDDLRISMIQRLMDLQRRAMSHLSR